MKKTAKTITPADPLINVMQLEEISQKLDKLAATLDRIEARQIKTTEMVTEVKEHEAPTTGSFATSDLGHPKP
jgi:hypothetical protein